MPSIKFLIDNPGVVTNIQQWHNNSPAKRQEEYARVLAEGNLKLKRDSTPGFIIPINTPGTTSIPYRVFKAADGSNAAILQQGLLSCISQRIHTTEPTGSPPSPYDIKNFVPAKVRLIVRTPNDGSRKSRITGVTYKADNSDSLTGSYGRKTHDEAIDNIYTDVGAAATVWVNAGSAPQSRSKKQLKEGAREWTD